MSAHSVTSDIIATGSLPLKMTDDSCKLQFSDTYARDVDAASATECSSRDWSAEIGREILPIVKQEPEQVHYIVEHLPMGSSFLLLML